jgi:branched-chain amino acid transport system substrate-binding protein
MVCSVVLHGGARAALARAVCRVVAVIATILSLAAAPGFAQADPPIKLGVLATLEGPFESFGRDAQRGMRMALDEFGSEVAGHTIELVVESSNGDQALVIEKAHKLIESDDVDIIIGPLAGAEGVALKEFAKTVPDKTIVNGASAAQDATLRDPAPNFFRFNTDGAQWIAGLGSYVFETKNYKRLLTVAEDYSFPRTQVMGFTAEYCAQGGKVVDTLWLLPGSKNYQPIVANILKQDVDAVYLGLSGADMVDFLTEYWEAGGRKPIVGGSISVDQTVLDAKGPFRDTLLGTPSARPIADHDPNPAWQTFVERYRERFPKGPRTPSYFAYGYYINTKAVLLALQEADGDLSDGHAAFREALSSLSFDTPTGPVSVDENRQAIANIFVTEVAAHTDGTYRNEVVKVLEGVNQTMNLPRDKFLALTSPTSDKASCP